MMCSCTSQAVSQDLKSVNLKYAAVEPAQRQHIKKKTIFFSKLLSTGCLDTHLAKSPLLPFKWGASPSEGNIHDTVHCTLLGPVPICLDKGNLMSDCCWKKTMHGSQSAELPSLASAESKVHCATYQTTSLVAAIVFITQTDLSFLEKDCQQIESPVHVHFSCITVINLAYLYQDCAW